MRDRSAPCAFSSKCRAKITTVSLSVSDFKTETVFELNRSLKAANACLNETLTSGFSMKLFGPAG